VLVTLEYGLPQCTYYWQRKGWWGMGVKG
jgi:hypothetical protein